MCYLMGRRVTFHRVARDFDRHFYLDPVPFTHSFSLAIRVLSWFPVDVSIAQLSPLASIDVSCQLPQQTNLVSPACTSPQASLQLRWQPCFAALALFEVVTPTCDHGNFPPRSTLNQLEDEQAQLGSGWDRLAAGLQVTVVQGGRLVLVFPELGLTVGALRGPGL